MNRESVRYEPRPPRFLGASVLDVDNCVYVTLKASPHRGLCRERLVEELLGVLSIIGASRACSMRA